MQALEQNTQEWLNYRKNKIGASDLPIILGISPYCSPYELWRKKLGFVGDDEETMAMRRGKELEPFVRKYINDLTEYHFIPKVVESPHFDWAIASLDGIDENHKIALEVKCTTEKNHKMIKSGNCPEIFYPQIQWQLACGGLEKVMVAHFFADEIVECVFRRDDIYIESTLNPAAQEFYRCMVEFTPPEATEKDYVQVVDEDFEKLAHQWIETHKELNSLKKKEEGIKKHLIDLTDDGNCRGYGLLIKKKNRKGSIDWNTLWEKACQKFPIEQEFNPEDFRKEDVWYWDVRIEKE